MTTQVQLPELGEDIEEAEVLKVLVSEGDEVKEGQDVIELETDKATVGVPSPAAGRVAKIAVKQGDHVHVGATVLTLETGAGDSAQEEEKEKEKPEAKKQEAKEQEEEQEPARAATATKPEPKKAAAKEEHEAEAHEPEAAHEPETAAEPSAEVGAPAARKLARELGVELAEVHGTGSRGRVTPEDVKAHVRRLVTGRAKSARELPRLPDFSQWGEVERQPMSGIRRRTASVVDLAWQMIPHVTHFDAADVTALEEARARHEREHHDGPRITLTALLLKACGELLPEFATLNASLDAEAGELVLKRYVHVGVAVDTEHGLLVPVVRDVDKKNVNQIASELGDLAARARERKLDAAALKGASFTITNLGGIGGTAFTPIIHHPQAAILGVASTRNEVVPHDGATRSRLMLPLCLSYDHRIVDGAVAARFLRRLAVLLGDPFELFLGA